MHHLSKADHIVILENGSIKYQGNWTQIREEGYLISSMVKEGIQPSESRKAVERDSIEPKRPGESIGVDEYDALKEIESESRNLYNRGFKPYIFYARYAGILNSTTSMVGY